MRFIKLQIELPTKPRLWNGTLLALKSLPHILVILVLFFVSFPRPVIAANGCSLAAINANTPYYDPCRSDDDTGCSATAALTGSDNQAKIWNFFAGKGLTPIAIAGILGNFAQEDGTYDPAAKEGGYTTALPADLPGSNPPHRIGYGIAQWTSAGRQDGLFKVIKQAGLEQYYGAGWGNQEKDKDIPADAIDKLLSIELNYAWDGDGNNVKAIASKLNNADSEKGDTGSAVLFHQLFEISADNASQIQERVTSATDALKKFKGSSSGDDGSSTSSCSSGTLGGVSTVADAIPWAMKFVTDTTEKYHPGGHAINKVQKGDGLELHFTNDGNVGTSGCWGALYCGQCTALSGWFVTRETSYTYGNGNGSEVVDNLKAKGVPTGKIPKPYSVFSWNNATNGHTGVVMGVEADGTVITIENNYTEPDVLSIRKYNLKKEHPDVEFAYVGDKLKVSGLSGQ